MLLPGQAQSFQHDISELFIFATVNEDVDGAVDHQSKMVDMHQDLYPFGPFGDLAVHGKLDAFISINDASDAVADDKNHHYED